ncbi:hypothetical protein [Streptomyces rugosispiralis]|uniref:Uncharacterized protein n=1 Tax=Streptomyces rugosispiralis TaxID=2967341 RepID=A0ABT1V6P1_9ACTN|nr:hypothetical protein [Streptomyces rugosispiralis]MCQ8192688.1 hypothetical protein [Streptomyces rugosispiralis]
MRTATQKVMANRAGKKAVSALMAKRFEEKSIDIAPVWLRGPCACLHSHRRSHDDHDAPTLVAAVDQLPAGPARVMDSWWFTARLKAADTAFWAKIHAMTVQGTAHSTVALMREPGGHSSHQQSTDSPDEVTLATSILDIRTPVLDIRGDLDAIAIIGATGTGSLQLTLRRDEPVLYNGGSGLPPSLAAPPASTASLASPPPAPSPPTAPRTRSADAPGSIASGAPPAPNPRASPGSDSTSEAAAISASGTPPEMALPGSPKLAADGTHTITRAHRIERNGDWTLTVPRFEGALEIDHRGLPAPGPREGVCGAHPKDDPG